LSKWLGVLYHPRREDARVVAHQAAEVLEKHGATVALLPAWDDEVIVTSMPEWQLVVTCGGDGTILRTTRLAAPLGVPQLGINVGRLGFLAELKPDELSEKLPLYLNGEYWIEKRSMLRATLLLSRGGQTVAAEPAGPGQQYDALNEALVARGALPRVIRVRVSIDGTEYSTFTGDGVMVTTPTGSTAYSLAAGGPVVAPQLGNLTLTAVCPHLARAVPLVLGSEAKIRLELLGGNAGILSIDGQVDVALGQGDAVEVSASPHVARFVRARSPGYFYELIGRVLR
jgi:NAD+ kinase